MINIEDVKRKKGEYWSEPGAGDRYHKAISSPAGVVKIKNIVECAIVTKYAYGRILDAGAGTGRFSRALAHIQGNKVDALDYSKEMLEINKKLSTDEGISNIRYFQGDIENLDFKDNEFDSVVSITVIRHFPQWQKILKEYIRVLKPGGILVFEMCSGNHIKIANKIYPRFGVANSEASFFNYEAEVEFEDLREWLSSNGIEILHTITYDFFNNNCFIRLIMINDFLYRVFCKIFNTVFRINIFAHLLAQLELSLLRYLPNGFSYNYMIVGKKYSKH